MGYDAPQNKVTGQNLPAKIESLQLRALDERPPQLQIATLQEAKEMSSLLVAAKDPSHPDNKWALNTILICAGLEWGLTPLAATQELFIDTRSGKVGQHAKAVVNAINRHPRYSYKILKRSKAEVSIQCFIDGVPYDDEQKGIISRTEQWAISAGKLLDSNKNNFVWKAYMENMLLHQCVRDASKYYFTGLFNGGEVFTEHEAKELEGEQVFTHPNDIRVEEILSASVEEGEKPTFTQVNEARAQVAEENGEPEKAEQLREMSKISDQQVTTLFKRGAGRWKPADVIKHVRTAYGTSEGSPIKDLTQDQWSEACEYLAANDPKEG